MSDGPFPLLQLECAKKPKKSGNSPEILGLHGKSLILKMSQTQAETKNVPYKLCWNLEYLILISWPPIPIFKSRVSKKPETNPKTPEQGIMTVWAKPAPNQKIYIKNCVDI